MKKVTFLVLSLLFFSIGFMATFSLHRSQSNCANSITCIKNLEAETSTENSGVFLGSVVSVPQINLSLEQNYPTVLGDTSDLIASNSAEKHIYVDLSKQTLYAYEGNNLFFQTLVSTGRWGRTPTGEFKIWIKIRSTKMSGGSGNDYYYLPNVPYVMFFYNSEVAQSRGYSLHGTYWHNNFGFPMSHGCVNLRTRDAQTLYEWATPLTTATTTRATATNPGTLITICEKLKIREGNVPLCLE